MIVVGKSCEDGIKKLIELPMNRSSGRLVDEVAICWKAGTLPRSRILQQAKQVAFNFGGDVVDWQVAQMVFRKLIFQLDAYAIQSQQRIGD